MTEKDVLQETPILPLGNDIKWGFDEFGGKFNYTGEVHNPPAQEFLNQDNCITNHHMDFM